MNVNITSSPGFSVDSGFADGSFVSTIPSTAFAVSVSSPPPPVSSFVNVYEVAQNGVNPIIAYIDQRLTPPVSITDVVLSLTTGCSIIGGVQFCFLFGDIALARSVDVLRFLGTTTVPTLSDKLDILIGLIQEPFYVATATVLTEEAVILTPSRFAGPSFPFVGWRVSGADGTFPLISDIRLDYLPNYSRSNFTDVTPIYLGSDISVIIQTLINAIQEVKYLFLRTG